MRDTVNAKVKFREEFRPFAPAVNEQDASTYFDMSKAEGQYPPRFMLMVSPVNAAKEHEIAAVSHMGTARMQTVRREWNPLYYDTIAAFGGLTGVPVLLNTSFNLRGEPIVNAPSEAFASFERSELDMLVLGEYIVRK
jgi:carbamoyltransferase